MPKHIDPWLVRQLDFWRVILTVLNTCSSNCPKFLSALSPGRCCICEGVRQERSIKRKLTWWWLTPSLHQNLKTNGQVFEAASPTGFPLISQIQMSPSATLWPPFQLCHWPWSCPTASGLTLYSVWVTMSSTQGTEIPSSRWLQQ